jgi:hypothetical protein
MFMVSILSGTKMHIKIFILVIFMFYLQLSMYIHSVVYGIEEVFIYSSENRDPFMPLITKDGKPLAIRTKIHSIGDITVEGLLYDPMGNSVVIVNDVILKKGDVTSEITVKDICKDSVTLSFKGKDHIFNIKE